jgi:hypothetical protein
MSVASGLELRRRKRLHHTVRFPAAVMGVAVVLSLGAQVVEAESSLIGWIAAAIPALGLLVMVKIALATSVVSAGDQAVGDDSADGPVADFGCGELPEVAKDTSELDVEIALLLPAARSAAGALVGQRRRVTVKALRDVLRADGYGVSTRQVAALLAELKPELVGELPFSKVVNG